jgi:hypothetical protein
MQNMQIMQNDMQNNMFNMYVIMHNLNMANI